jgi:hypothetical protein
MLDRAAVDEFLDDQFGEMEIEIPGDISKETLVEAFCQYTEDDYYEWLDDNFESFFNHGNPDWEWIGDKVKSYQGNEE